MNGLREIKGFTLIELIAVILILGVVGTTVFSFIGFSAQLFVDVNGRDKVLADSRFVVERLNRELRNAVPNSVRITGNASEHCIEYMPIKWSTFYLGLPIAPEPASNLIRVVELSGDFDSFTREASDVVILYPIASQDIYAGNSPKRLELLNTALPGPGAVSSGSVIDLVLAESVQLLPTAESPSSRLYICGQPVSYCVSNTGQIVRYTDYGILPIQQTSISGNALSNGSVALMGENLQNILSTNPGGANNSAAAVADDPFRVVEPTLQRNAFVNVLLRFAREDQPNEVIVFNNEVHVANVP